jgi:hypothetical protein
MSRPEGCGPCENQLGDSTIRSALSELALHAIATPPTSEATGRRTSRSQPISGAVPWRRNGENPKLFTIELACRFIAIARETKCLGCRQKIGWN